VVEGAPLLREYTGNGIEGSNPFLSAITLNICYRYGSRFSAALPPDGHIFALLVSPLADLGAPR
jgi:hypothetical protein